jgi:hypothetical protein
LLRCVQVILSLAALITVDGSYGVGAVAGQQAGARQGLIAGGCARFERLADMFLNSVQVLHRLIFPWAYREIGVGERAGRPGWTRWGY